jgi:hypothetical protein
LLSENDLKANLKKYGAEGSTRPTEAELDELITSMLGHIGTTDSELRDDLIYSSLAGWIMHEDLISINQCRLIFTTVLDDEHLFYKIGEKETDSVFTRTFSVLLLPPLLIRHRNSAYLDESDVQRAKTSLLRYLEAEKDRRGYVEGRGWAHGIAHCADALDDVAQCRELGAGDLGNILTALKPVIAFREFVYGFGEEERLVTPVIAIIRCGLVQLEDILNWFSDLGRVVSKERAIPQKMIVRANIQNFLQSFYFRLMWSASDPALLPAIEELLFEMSPFKGN